MSDAHSRRSFLARCWLALGAATARWFGGPSQAAAASTPVPSEPVSAADAHFSYYSYSAEDAWNSEAVCWVTTRTYDAQGRLIAEWQAPASQWDQPR